ncbi:MAG: MMPL family transporter, partial [Deltaproteobacteria bacterium]|nr:MMPL family transporter [Deltaproteobacteria bacterium]
DSTVYLIQITPGFPSTDILKGKDLVDRLRALIPKKIADLKAEIPAIGVKADDLKWYLTGKTAFHYESDMIFDRETVKILLFSFIMVMALLLGVYRSIWSGVILMIPILAGIGPNYGLIYLRYSEVNPVVMGASGVLFGLGTDYGVHLWGRFREEIERGSDADKATATVFEQTGPPVLLGGLTSILAFLCLCLSDQPAMAQFGWVGASGLVLTLASTLFLFPALVTVLTKRKRDYFPRMHASFSGFSHLYKHAPITILIVSGLVISVSFFFAARLSYEKDLFKVFLARKMESMEVSERISRKFHSNFAQPTYLSFDVDDIEQGLILQRAMDVRLERLVDRDREINSFDSISYLMSPEAVQNENTRTLAEIAQSWPQLQESFSEKLNSCNLGDEASEIIRNSFQRTGLFFEEMAQNGPAVNDHMADVERSWYTAEVNGKYRFLTLIRFSHDIADNRKL